ncbi:MAG: PEP-CTERM sorting domain-containing protein [Bryobacteraceae bacterium]
MLRKSSPAFSFVLLALTVLLMAPSHAGAASITVTSSTTVQGALYRYDYAISNSSIPDLLSVTLSVPAQANAVQNLMAPAGFSAFFDAGLGLVDFVEGSRAFTVGSTIAGFSFASPFQLGATNFTALSLDSNQNPVITSGTTSAVPEPASMGLFAAGLAILLSARKCRRRFAS